MQCLLEATEFQNLFDSGARTRPILCSCEDSKGIYRGDYVVKLKGFLDSGVRGLKAEIISSLLATYFDLNTPEIGIVEIENSFAELLASSKYKNDEDREKIRNSVGYNFGSAYYVGAPEWERGTKIENHHLVTAAKILCFDALIQNSDRRVDKTNLLVSRDDMLILIDHELAFGFTWDVIPQESSWRVEHQNNLDQHVLYQGLKRSQGKNRRGLISDGIEQFADKLVDLSQNDFKIIESYIPQCWLEKDSDVGKIFEYLEDVVSNAKDFISQIRAFVE